MKPFNLEDALAGKPVVTRKGMKIDAIYKIPEVISDPYNILVVIKGSHYWTDERGRMCRHDYDLFMAEEEIVYYNNVYENGLGYGCYPEIELCKLQSLGTMKPIAIQKTTINTNTKEIKVEIVHKY